MDYIGEHPLPGKLGHFFAILSLAASFVAVISYYRSTNARISEEEKSWQRMGRIAFGINVAAIFAMLFTIIHIITNYYFEYNFAWEHSSKALPFKYLLACVWEAQEGSFLLWTIWLSVLGIILIGKAGKWESPVMTVMSFGQFSVATMLIGIYFFGNKVGLNPFILVREKMQAPIFSRPDYLSIPQMQDGQGLSALLQNYWMTIHPPILFLGYASTIVPFAYSIAGLWKRQFGEWSKPALPWALFSACLLGTGIMMGAAWAYESLSFGGYWSWDPVENASLAPWLVLVAGLHTQLVYNATGHSLRATHFFYISEFVLILYSTFLTRSGVLGDTSVHAFVNSGMNVQLFLFLAVFLVPSYMLFIARYKKIPHIVKEEATDSREFWMFIGALVIFLSSMFIIVSTSLPVINLVKEKKMAESDDRPFSYNRIIIFVAILLGILTAVVQYLKYKQTSRSYILKKLMLPTVIALTLSILVSAFGGINYNHYGAGFMVAIHLAMFAAIYAVVANFSYIWIGMNGKLKAAGGSVAHLGFGLLIVGILLSSAKKEVLSYNTTGIDIGLDPSTVPAENITLLQGIRTDMGKYWATFVGDDSTDEKSKTIYYDIHLQKKDGSADFHLYPNFMKATKGQEGVAPNPDKQHYWNKDIFAYVNGASRHDAAKNDTSSFKGYPVKIRDTIWYSKGLMILDTVLVNPNTDKVHFKPTDTALMAKLTVIGKDSSRWSASPYFYLRDNVPVYVNDTVFTQDLAVRFNRVADNHRIEIGVRESQNMVPFVALKVLEFPQINILWIGTIIMVIGFIMSLLWRRKQNRGLPVQG